MFDPDLWLRQQFWQQLWKGPGAVSAYWSIAIQLVCVGLSALGPTDLQGPNLWILSIIVLLGLLLILGDESTYAEYRRQEASGSGGRGFRLPLCLRLATLCLSLN
jgi:hypothetical protein